MTEDDLIDAAVEKCDDIHKNARHICGGEYFSFILPPVHRDMPNTIVAVRNKKIFEITYYVEFKNELIPFYIRP